MKSNELFEQIHCGLIKENTKIEVIKNGNVISKIKYINGGLRWKEGTFSTQSLCDIDTDFEIVEEDINIQSIEELNDSCYDASFIAAEEEYYHNLTREILNKVIKAVKQLDKKINIEYCNCCGVELTKENKAIRNMCNECKYGMDYDEK